MVLFVQYIINTKHGDIFLCYVQQDFLASICRSFYALPDKCEPIIFFQWAKMAGFPNNLTAVLRLQRVAKTNLSWRQTMGFKETPKK